MLVIVVTKRSLALPDDKIFICFWETTVKQDPGTILFYYTDSMNRRQLVLRYNRKTDI